MVRRLILLNLLLLYGEGEGREGERERRGRRKINNGGKKSTGRQVGRRRGPTLRSPPWRPSRGQHRYLDVLIILYPATRICLPSLAPLLPTPPYTLPLACMCSNTLFGASHGLQRPWKRRISVFLKRLAASGSERRGVRPLTLLAKTPLPDFYFQEYYYMSPPPWPLPIALLPSPGHTQRADARKMMKTGFCGVEDPRRRRVWRR